jgi:hypothetical protein
MIDRGENESKNLISELLTGRLVLNIFSLAQEQETSCNNSIWTLDEQIWNGRTRCFTIDKEMDTELKNLTFEDEW